MSSNKTVSYYSQIGSRLGYKLIAGGHRHFGYYKDKNYWYIPHAAVAMIDYLASYGEVKPGEKILDAGCGEGRASLRIAQKYKANLSGIDLVPQSLRIAKRKAGKANIKIDYRLGDYNNLPYKNETFDMVFTLETFTHSADPEKTLQEFWRVLKPGGRIVIFDYSIKDLETVTAEARTALESIAKHTNCPSFIKITHNYYQKSLPTMGFRRFEVLNQTDSVARALNQIYVLSWPFFWTLKLFNVVYNHPNVLIAHYGKIWLRNDTWRYITVKIQKPK